MQAAWMFAAKVRASALLRARSAELRFGHVPDGPFIGVRALCAGTHDRSGAPESGSIVLGWGSARAETVPDERKKRADSTLEEVHFRFG
jgi:hypothetical protein